MCGKSIREPRRAESQQPRFTQNPRRNPTDNPKTRKEAKIGKRLGEKRRRERSGGALGAGEHRRADSQLRHTAMSHPACSLPLLSPIQYSPRHIGERSSSGRTESERERRRPRRECPVLRPRRPAQPIAAPIDRRRSGALPSQRAKQNRPAVSAPSAPLLIYVEQVARICN